MTGFSLFQAKIIIFISVLFFLFPSFTYAYLDPGSGSYLVQLLIATVLGTALFFKDAAGKIRDIFKKK